MHMTHSHWHRQAAWGYGGMAQWRAGYILGDCQGQGAKMRFMQQCRPTCMYRQHDRWCCHLIFLIFYIFHLYNIYPGAYTYYVCFVFIIYDMFIYHFILILSCVCTHARPHVSTTATVQIAQIWMFRRKRALWSGLFSARENSIGVITDIKHMNYCQINDISIKLKQ
jgi:hypothetical protein